MNIKNQNDDKIDLSDLSDFELAQKAASGDIAAFEKIYWEHHRRVYSVCFRMAKNTADAEDLTQQVFLLLFRKIGSFRGDSAFSTWLHRMTVNTVLMHFRKAKTIKESTTEDGEMHERINLGSTKHKNPQYVDRIALTRAIGELPDGYRKVFILHDIQGYQHDEIAKILCCANGTSKSQLYKARRKLCKLLNAENKFPMGRQESPISRAARTAG